MKRSTATGKNRKFVVIIFLHAHTNIMTTNFLFLPAAVLLFTLSLTDSLEKCPTKSFENEYSTFCNFQILYHKSALYSFTTMGSERCHYV